MPEIHIDIETYCNLDLKKHGVYRYVADPTFEVMLIAYTDPLTGDLTLIDTVGEELTEYLPGGPYKTSLAVSKTERDLWDALGDLKRTLESGEHTLHAHNANFERLALAKYLNSAKLLKSKNWRCSAVKAASCGLPRSLADVSAELGFGENDAKDASGKALIRYFCTPCKQTKTNAWRSRNLPEHATEKWQAFKDYCAQDVRAEMAVCKELAQFRTPKTEQEMYNLDALINDRGVLVDLELAKDAIHLNGELKEGLVARMRDISGISNPNSNKQLCEYFGSESVAADVLTSMYADLSDVKKEVVRLRRELGKTSVAKYQAMVNCAGEDTRVRGMLMFGGAGRTQRWAGRHVQLQNLPRNYMAGLELARDCVKTKDLELLTMLYSTPNRTLSELIRTAFVAPAGKVFAVADYSAIEARVIAWLAGERWRLDVFNGHGKIYEASAAMMFGVPIESVTKGSDLRAKGKIAELALGYGGSVGALKQMGGEAMGLAENDMKNIVDLWRRSNQAIVRFWYDLNDTALEVVATRSSHVLGNLRVSMCGSTLCITLPSGRDVRYSRAQLCKNRFGGPGLRYRGRHPKTGAWTWVESYGGKLAENVTQAVARDILVHAMLSLDAWGFRTVMHVHDEVVAEVPEAGAPEALDRMCGIMCRLPGWAGGLPIDAEGFISDFYKKD